MDGAPSQISQPGEKSYDSIRKQYAHFLGMDFLFTAREYCQSLQTDSTGTKVLVNSSKSGEILVVKPVPSTIVEKPWFNRKLRFPRQYLGIPKIQERVEKLSYLVHVLAQNGIPNRSVWKGLKRLSLVWYHTRYKDVRKHIHSLTQKILRSRGYTRSPWMSSNKGLSQFPTFVGEKIHESGIVAPLWSRNPLVKEDKRHRKVEPVLT